jgi:hypothetical protein
MTLFLPKSRAPDDRQATRRRGDGVRAPPLRCAGPRTGLPDAVRVILFPALEEKFLGGVVKQYADHSGRADDE